MQDRISKEIYDLFKIREDPLKNLDKIRTILDILGEFGIEFSEPIELRSYKDSIKRTEKPLEAFTLLEDCLRRFLSNEQLLEFDRAREIRDFADRFHSDVYGFVQELRNEQELLRLRITEENHEYFEELLQKLIGVRLEYELIPNLLEKMGYERNSTAFKIDNKTVEVDGRYERKTYSGARKDRLIGKDVVIVECKTALGLKDIKEFDDKSKLINDKYIKEKMNWNYDRLSFEAWMIACYGWKDDLVKEANARGIVPFTSQKLECELKKYKIYDPRIPICPSSN